MSKTTAETNSGSTSTTMPAANPILAKMTDATLKAILQACLDKNEKEVIALLSALTLTDAEVQKYITEAFPDPTPLDGISLKYIGNNTTLLEFLLLRTTTAAVAIRKFQVALSRDENRTYLNIILETAVRCDDLEAVKLLLDCNPDTNFCLETLASNAADTVFTTAVVAGSKRVVEFLLPKVKLSSDILAIDELDPYLRSLSLNKKFSMDVNGFGRAAGKGHAEIVEMLLNSKANMDLHYWRSGISKSVSSADTALMAAANKGHLATVRVLLEHQANVNQVNLLGETALMQATMWGHNEQNENVVSKEESDEIHDRLQIIQRLLQANANVHALELSIKFSIRADYYPDLSPLMHAFKWGCEGACHLLIRNGASVHQLDSEGGSILIQLCREYNFEDVFGNPRKVDLLRLLLDQGVNIHLRGRGISDRERALESTARGYEGTALEIAREVLQRISHNLNPTSTSTASSSSSTTTATAVVVNSNSSSSSTSMVECNSSSSSSQTTQNKRDADTISNIRAYVDLLQAEHDIQDLGLNSLELQRQLIAAFKKRMSESNAENKGKQEKDHEILSALIPTLISPELFENNPTLLKKLKLRLIDSVMPSIFAIRTHEQLSVGRDDNAFNEPLPIIFSYASCRVYSLDGPAVRAPVRTTTTTVSGTATAGPAAARP